MNDHRPYKIEGRKYAKRIGGEFVPSQQMEDLLNVDLDPLYPPADIIERGARAGVTPVTIRNWFKNPEFREWYTRAFRAGAHVFTTVAFQELIRLIKDPTASSNAKVSGINTLLSKFDESKAVESKQAALKSLIDVLAPQAKGSGDQVEFAMVEDTNGLGMKLAGRVTKGGRPQTEDGEPQTKDEEEDWLPRELVKPPEEVEGGPAEIPPPPILEQ